MATSAYHEVMDRVRQLSSADQLRLLKELAALIRQQIATWTQRSVMELQGLGKETWQGVDVQEYVDRERASWNG